MFCVRCRSGWSRLLSGLVYVVKTTQSMHVRPIYFVRIVAALLLLAIVDRAGAAPQLPQVGDTYELILTRESAQQSTAGSPGNSHDKDTIVERVVGAHVNGLELEYDLPDTATADERVRTWQFPVRIIKPFDGPAQLLNGPQLEAKVDGWLKAGGMDRAACGHWIFTWNAFRIECDPESVIRMVQRFDLRSVDLRDGATYQDADASGPAKLARKTDGAGGAAFTADMPVNADAVRRARAEFDVALGEITSKPISLEAALLRRAQDVVSGTIAVTFEADSGDNVRRRTKVTRLEITTPDGRSETRTVTETLERRVLSRRE